MATWLENINVLELSAVKLPANRKRKLHQKAEWSAAYVNDLPDGAFLHVAPGGKKDNEGKTTPRGLRYFPVRDADGKLDAAHVRNALARIPQANLPAGIKGAARAKASRLLEQITKSEDLMWISEENLDEYFSKAAMPDLQKQAIKAAIAALNASKADMPEDLFKGGRAALAKLLGFGAAQKSVEELEAKVAEVTKAAQDAEAGTKAAAKAALDHLQTETPAINDAVAKLAELAGVTPTFKHVEALPPELKVQWEAMQKSQEADRAKLAELQKSLEQQQQAAVASEYVTKAAAMSHVPAKTEALGNLMHAVAKSEDKDAIATLEQLLKSVEEIAKQSELFRERGGSGHLPQDKGGVFGKIDAMAAQLVEKSSKPLTIEQARTHVLEANPELFEQYNANA